MVDDTLVVLTDATGLSEDDPELVDGLKGHITAVNLPLGDELVFFYPEGIEKLFLINAKRFTLASEVGCDA